MSTLLKAYLMNTDNPFLMFKCLYEDIQKYEYTKPPPEKIPKVGDPIDARDKWLKDRDKERAAEKKRRKKLGLPEEEEEEEEEEKEKEEVKGGWKFPSKPKSKPKSKKLPISPIERFTPKKTAIPLFEDAVEDTGNDDLEDAYNEMKDLRRRMMGKKTGIGQDIFAVKLRIPPKREDDKYKNSPYSEHARETNLRTLKEHLNKIKIAINKNIKNINPAAVKRLNNAIDVWIRNIPELIKDIKLEPLKQKDIQEMFGQRISTPAKRKHIGMPTHVDLESTKDSIDKWIEKLRKYDENINIFLTHDEKSKENIMRKFFTSKKIDELEDIAKGELTFGELPDNSKTKRLKTAFNRIKRNLKQKRPDGTLIEQLDKSYYDLHKVRRLPKEERKGKEKFFQTIRQRLDPIIREKKKEKELEDEAMLDLYGKEKRWEGGGFI